MKNKITPSVILLIITVIFFIAGIFFMGIQARQQISDTEQSLDAFISQVKDKQQALNDAQTSFSSAVKEKKRSSELSPAKKLPVGRLLCRSIAILRSHPKLSLPFSVRTTADSRDIL